MAFAAQDVLSLAGKSGTQAPAWSYGPEPEQLHLARLGDRANHLVIYGPQGTAGAMADAWDWGDVAATGQERFALLVEGFADVATTAQLIAALALARETRLATVADLVVGPHPGLALARRRIPTEAPEALSRCPDFVATAEIRPEVARYRLENTLRARAHRVAHHGCGDEE